MILVDSDVIIAHLRGHQPAREWLRHAREAAGRLGLSAVSVVEVAGDARQAERRETIHLLSSFQFIPASERVAWHAAELMRTHQRAHPGIGLGDYLVAATAKVEGCELATLNVRHFPMFPGLKAPFTL